MRRRSLTGTGNTKKSDKNYLVIAAGQSNLVGWETGAPTEEWLNQPIPNTYINNINNQLLYPNSNQGNNGHGVELNLGYTLSRLTTGNIYICKYGMGATSLSTVSAPNDWSPTGVLFDQLVSIYSNMISQFNNNNIEFEVAGVYWNQGERDAGDEQSSLDYYTNLVALEARFRSEFSLDSSVPFIPVRLHKDLSGRIYAQSVRDAVDQFQNRLIVDDLSLQADFVHLTSAAQNALALRVISKLKL